jgi:hypothetical protein
VTAVAGCGSSASPHTSSATTRARAGNLAAAGAPATTQTRDSAASSAQAPATPPAGASTTATRQAPTTAATGQAPTTAATGQAPTTATTGQASTTGTAQLTTYQGTAGASGARLPATFRIEPGGRLSPPTVDAPAQVPVELTVISGDGHTHRVVLRAPAVHVLTVPAHGRASVLLRDLKSGRYVLRLDGVARGALQVGVAPGP